ncbi:hypothetical protein KY326_00035 [Candidatus Woesearchaeota archaeon]|nr:hypothetical protein [Candidatus Woesearchaeota archaeon]
MLLDLLCFLIFVAISAYYYMYFGRITEAYPLTINSGTWYLISFVLLSAVAIVLYAVNVTIFKRLVYKYTLEKTQDMKTWFRFSIIWIIPWFIIFVFIIQAIKDEWRGGILFAFWLLYVMLTAIARVEMKKKVKDTVFIAFSKFFRFKTLFAYLLMAIIFLIAFIVFGATYLLGQATFASALIFMFLLYSTWARYYLSLELEK